MIPIAIRCRAPPVPPDQDGQREELARSFERLLLDANYVKMPREEIIACAEYQAQVGLVVKANLSDYAQLQVYYRGIRHQPRSVRPGLGWGGEKTRSCTSSPAWQCWYGWRSIRMGRYF